MYNELRE